MRWFRKADDYIARVAFAYPDDELADQRWKRTSGKTGTGTTRSKPHCGIVPTAVESMNFDYSIKGGTTAFVPSRYSMTDKRHTSG